jgi:hypothetical protein
MYFRHEVPLGKKMISVTQLEIGSGFRGPILRGTTILSGVKTVNLTSLGLGQNWFQGKPEANISIWSEIVLIASQLTVTQRKIKRIWAILGSILSWRPART